MGTFSMTVAAPPRAVFDYLAEPRNRAEWQSSLRAVEMLTDGPTRVGTRWVDRTAVGAGPRMWITEMRAPREDQPGAWAEVGHWRGLSAELTLVFAPEDGATLLSGTVRISSTGPWLPLRLALGTVARPAVVADLRRAARILEARPSA
jgi:uncharacterized protein YndB with AHSA1/START domain